MSSLKRKNETAVLEFLKGTGVFDNGVDGDGNPLYTVQFLTSQENQKNSLAPPAVVAVWQESKHVVDGKGRSLGRITGRLEVLIFGRADKQGEDDTPEEDHADIAGLVRSCFQISDLADQLSEQVEDYHCFYAHPRPPAALEPKGSNFLESLAWETASCETDC